MSTITPVAFYSGETIPGTTQIGNLSVGTTPQDYGVVGANNGILYIATPDQDLGYVIAYYNITNSNVGFWRSPIKTEESFIELAEYVSRQDGYSQIFIRGTDAKDWLNNNGYWTSWGGNNLLLQDGFELLLENNYSFELEN